MINLVLKYGEYLLWILVGSGFVFEIAPIKISPLGLIGSRLNKSLSEKVESLENKIDQTQVDLRDHIISSQRNSILVFAKESRRGIDHTEEEFNQIIALHDYYQEYLKANDLENGKIDLAYKHIEEVYNEHIRNNDFIS